MGTDGGREWPRPPRRVPFGAAPLGGSTSIETRTARTTQPVRRPPRAWYLVPVVLAVLAAGVLSAFVARERYDTVDPAKAQREIGPAVVTVLATTCAETGRVTGVLIGGGKVLTVASAIREPAAVAVVTATGEVRRALVMGVGKDRVAVLRLQGTPLSPRIPELAERPPRAGSELALVNYDDTGAGQAAVVGLAAGTATKLATGVDDRSLGAPVVDSRNRVVGVVTASDPSGTTLLGPEAIRQYAGVEPPVTPERGGQCAEAKGPQDPVVPVLLGSRTALAEKALATFTTYIAAVNRHDFEGIRNTYTGQQLVRAPLDKVKAQHRTTYAFGPRVSEVLPYADGARARMTFTTIHHVDGPSPGMSCARWDLVYTLRPDGDVLKIAGLTSATLVQSCDEA